MSKKAEGCCVDAPATSYADGNLKIALIVYEPLNCLSGSNQWSALTSII